MLAFVRKNYGHCETADIDKKMNMRSEYFEGHTYIIGREGHIYLNDVSVSRQHAELKIVDGRIHLRDLDSTNGTYLVRGNKLVYFQEGYVRPQQIIVIGSRQYEIKSLLTILGIFADFCEQTELNFEPSEEEA